MLAHSCASGVCLHQVHLCRSCAPVRRTHTHTHTHTHVRLYLSYFALGVVSRILVYNALYWQSGYVCVHCLHCLYSSFFFVCYSCSLRALGSGFTTLNPVQLTPRGASLLSLGGSIFHSSLSIWRSISFVPLCLFLCIFARSPIIRTRTDTLGYLQRYIGTVYYVYMYMYMHIYIYIHIYIHIHIY